MDSSDTGEKHHNKAWRTSYPLLTLDCSCCNMHINSSFLSFACWNWNFLYEMVSGAQNFDTTHCSKILPVYFSTHEISAYPGGQRMTERQGQLETLHQSAPSECHQQWLCSSPHPRSLHRPKSGPCACLPVRRRRRRKQVSSWDVVPFIEQSKG